MDQNEIKMCAKYLHELLSNRDPDMIKKIEHLNLSNASESQISRTSKHCMQIIRDKLREWNISIESFFRATIDENAESSFRCLLELVQTHDFERLNKLKKTLETVKTSRTTVVYLHDCVETISDYMDDLENYINIYKNDFRNRISYLKGIKEYATVLYRLLNELFIDSQHHPLEKVECLQNILNELMSRLLNLAVIIVEFPPRVIKRKTPSQTGTKFTASLQCIIEEERLFSTRISINPYFLTEEYLQLYVQGNLDKSCLITADKKDVAVYHWQLRNMIWDPSHQLHADRRRSDRITDSKGIILFLFKATAKPYAFSKTFNLDIALQSDTVVATVHSNQEINALLTLFWDDYFRINRQLVLDNGRLLCEEFVDVNILIENISDYFERETSRKLTSTNIAFLKQKIRTISNGKINFLQFSRTQMPQSEFSFGCWILSIMKLIKIPDILKMWIDDIVDGFLPKNIDNLFHTCNIGTFVLRFSEKNPKIGVVLKTALSIDPWNPFTIEECRNRSLAERLMDFPDLEYIRKADGNVMLKYEALQPFIVNQNPDEGYTQRGFSSSMLYADNIDDLNDIHISPLSPVEETSIFDEFC